MRFNLALGTLSALALFAVAMAASCAVGEDLANRVLPGGAGSSSSGSGGDVGSGGEPGAGGAGAANSSGGSSAGSGGAAGGGAGNTNTGGGGNTNTGGGGNANGGSGGVMDSGMVRGGGGTAGSGGAIVDASMGGAGGVSEASSTGGTRNDAQSEAGNDVAIVAEASDDGAADANLAEANPGTVVFSDNFEGDAVGMQAAGWNRVGGSDGDWEVATDMTRDFRQDHAQSSTFRLCYAGPTISGAATVLARAKILLSGSSGATTGMVCVRYAVSGGAFQCLALEPPGLRIKTSGGDGQLLSLPVAVAVGTSYNVALSVDATGLLRAYAGGSLLGSFQSPVSVPSGVVAVATQSAEAAFDDIVLTVP